MLTNEDLKRQLDELKEELKVSQIAFARSIFLARCESNDLVRQRDAMTNEAIRQERRANAAEAERNALKKELETEKLLHDATHTRLAKELELMEERALFAEETVGIVRALIARAEADRDALKSDFDAELADRHCHANDMLGAKECGLVCEHVHAALAPVAKNN